jgi:hypothetical protein
MYQMWATKMSIFTKPVSQYETSDLQLLMDEAAVENVRLEFKLEIPSKDETLKKLSSFANAFGGFAVIGAQAKSTDGRLLSLPGVDVEAGYKQKIVQWSFDGASPPLTVEVSDPIAVPAGNGKVCYVIYVPESDVAPHFLNGRKGVYVRSDEFSARFEARLANETELRHLFDRRRSILERRARLAERASKRFSTYIRRKYPESVAESAKLGSRLEICVAPRFPARPMCEETKLASLVLGSAVSWRQTGYPRMGNGPVSQHESVILLQSAEEFSIFEANIWGLLFYGTEIGMDARGTVGIHMHHLIGYVLVSLRHAGALLQALGYSGPLVIDVALASILGVPLLTFHGGHSAHATAGSELDENVTFGITTTSEALREKVDGVAMDVLRSIFFAVNMADAVDSPEKLGELLRRGYGYNFWR